MRHYCGIDVSAWQGEIDWSEVRASGVRFAILRAGCGRQKDKRFDEYVRGAHENGIPVGGYWFSYALRASDGAAEADACRDALGGNRLELPVYYDFEYDTERYAAERGVRFTPQTRAAVINAFVRRLKKHGISPGVYLSGDYLANRLNVLALYSCPLWIAEWYGYPSGAVGYTPSAEKVNTRYGKPQVWQFSSKGRINGINGEVDLDYGYYDSLPEVKNTPPASSGKALIKRGDRVRVRVKSVSGGRRYAAQYDGKPFVLWYDAYDVISVSGDRAVIGIGKTVTAAVRTDEIEKL